MDTNEYYMYIPHILESSQNFTKIHFTLQFAKGVQKRVDGCKYRNRSQKPCRIMVKIVNFVTHVFFF